MKNRRKLRVAVFSTGDEVVEPGGGRPPAAVPQGHTEMSGPNYGIAVLDGWKQGATVGNAFPQLNQATWTNVDISYKRRDDVVGFELLQRLGQL